jgi:GTP-binding protein HflX
LTIDDDLMTEKTKTQYTLQEWKSTWMSRVGEENAVYFGNKQRKF